MSIIDFEKIRSLNKKDFESRFFQYNEFLKFLGDPQKKLTTVIVAGSTAKGSVASYLSEVLQSHHIKVGLFTSPHVVSIQERIKVDGTRIKKERLDYYEKKISEQIQVYHRKKRDKYIPSYFELLTLTAFFYFLEKKVDLSILEVGLGGRLDATNVSSPVLNILTSICMDHAPFLGNTLQKITKEKAEVIKENSYTLVAENKAEILNIVRKKCQRMNSTLFIEGEDFKTRVMIDQKSRVIRGLYQQGKHKFNVTLPVSTGAFKSLGLALFAAGVLLKHVFQTRLQFSCLRTLDRVDLPARFQIVKFKNKTFIIDGAHNSKSMAELVRSIRGFQYTPGNLLFLMLQDKDLDGCLKILGQLTDSIILTSIQHPREMAMSKVHSRAVLYFQHVIKEYDIQKAFHRCLGSDQKYVWVCGSFYLCARVLKIMAGDR
ncbi:MAG: hypothetical protein JW827_09210 [Spirochaetes bacterium]|nr:hypothetical protein [Spirochaetota bacterium]